MLAYTHHRRAVATRRCLRRFFQTLVVVCVTLVLLLGTSPRLLKRLYKHAICALDMDGAAKTLQLVQVTPESPSARERRQLVRPQMYPRIFCFVNTISVHMRLAQAVADTWGQRCDKLVFFSNVTDTIYVGKGTSREKAFEVVYIDVIADHDHLWQKTKASLQYVYEHFRHDYDWFYKADDDAYVIVDNLRAYLQRPEIVMHYKRVPMQLGHRFNLAAEVADYYMSDPKLQAEWSQRFDRWIFNSGGPGYVMNRLYLDKFVASIPERHCFSDAMSALLPEDTSIAYCMMWHGVVPWDTRDTRGRERWHSDKPHSVYDAHFANPEYWYNVYHRGIGGIRTEDDCCAPDSVAFHYIRPRMMYQIERTLYFCRADAEVTDLIVFNEKYGLALGEKVLVYGWRYD